MWNCIYWTQAALGATCRPTPLCNEEGEMLMAMWDRGPPNLPALLHLELSTLLQFDLFICLFKYITE